MNTVIGDHHLPTSDPHPPALPVSLDAGWIIAGPVDCAPHEDTVTLRCVCDEGAGSERGLASRESYSRIGLSFEVFIPSGACFVAKVHQTEQTDQCTNSYHLYCSPRGTFLARHNHVFRHLDIPRDRWVSLGLACADGTLQVFHDGRLLHSVRDTQMTEGFAILSVKSGQVQLRGVRITEPPAPATRAGETGFRLVNGAPPARPPRVSIITTVYDRVECLRRCLQSVRALDFQDYEHVIVSDAPPEGVARQIADLVSDLADPRVRYYDLDNRHNNWGIAPAAVGLRQSSGEYVCFLSDDNGYTPDHISNLIHALDAQPDIGFAYSSCRYAGRLVLSNPTPRPAQIDLGQPMFRRELFELHLDNDLPFDMLAWDWYMIDAFLTKSVRWAHVNEPSFIFRLAEYPHLMAGER